MRPPPFSDWGSLKQCPWFSHIWRWSSVFLVNPHVLIKEQQVFMQKDWGVVEVWGICGSCRHGRCRYRSIMGLWCGMKDSREASAWTRGHGTWDTSVYSTATAPCTETQFEIHYYICCCPLGWMFMICAGIDLAHWCQEVISNMLTYSKHAHDRCDPQLWGHIIFTLFAALYVHCVVKAAQF